jgi:long-chain acyl-CoA synthetase
VSKEKRRGKIVKVTLHVILSQMAKSLPEKIALRYGKQKVSYWELDEKSNSFAGVLSDLGVKKGDCVALFLHNSIQFVVAFFGALKVGAVVTAVNPLHVEGEVERQLCDSKAQTIIVLESLWLIVENIIDKTLLKNVVIVTDLGNAVICSKVTDFRVKLNVLDFESLIRERDVVRIGVLVDSDDVAVIQYTGGTTGVPKGVLLSHTNIVSNALSFASHLKCGSNDVFLSVLPFFHIYGLTACMIMPISIGAEMVISSKFSSVKSLQDIEEFGVAVFCGTPVMYGALLAKLEEKTEKYNLKSLRVCISGSSSLPSTVQKRFMQLTGCLLVEGYGLTEASPVTHCNPINTSIDSVKIGSIGKPLLDTKACIVDLKTGQTILPIGEKGELAVKGPQIMRGYWQKPDETAQVFRNTWLLTGDIAYKDKEDYFYIVDRKKDLIKHKDYSIYPKELEEILQQHPSIELCTVIGKQKTPIDEIPKAFIILKKGKENTKKEEIINFVNNKIAPYKALKEIEYCKKLPTNTTTGKIIKQTLKQKENNISI